MTSESFVWIYLPGDLTPTVCGRYQHTKTAAGATGSFVYGASYLKNPDAIALDPITLSLRAQEFMTTNSNGVFGSLMDAIPDDWGRYVIDKVHGQQEFPVGYMLHSSDDAIGNLAFSTSPKEAPDQTRPIGADLIENAREILLDIESGKDVPLELIGKVRANTAMGGARPKLTVELDGHLWLAKFPTRRDDPLLPMAKLEAAMLELAGRCGIESAYGEVVHDDVLLVRRFDRGPVDQVGSSRRDGFLSARTLFESSGTRYGYAGSYVRLATEISRYSCQGAHDQKEIFRRMVFNAVTSNTDDHERNHGLIADDMPGSYRLAPAYDLVPRIHGTSVRHQAMLVGANSSIATRENLLADSAAFGLTRPQAENVLEEVVAKVGANWRECMQEQGITAQGLSKLERCFAGFPAEPAPR